ncbi:MAG: tRNA (guanosine(46)-N7)-methyltransferase TrmB [Phycisphaeraceae bacterium]
MGASLSTHGRTLDVGRFGYDRDRLPALDAGPIDLAAWFTDDDADPAPGDVARPIDLEIGSGKGTFLIQQASQTPHVNYVGIEYARAFWRHAADRMRRHNRTNVRMVHFEAGAFVRSFIADRAIRQVHVYFPDPWPKKRHHKRRLIQAPFLLDLHRILADPGDDSDAGQVRLATDHADYFAWMEAHAAEVADRFDRLPFDRPASADEGELVGTNFERKYRTQGRTFQGMILRKR